MITRFSRGNLGGSLQAATRGELPGGSSCALPVVTSPGGGSRAHGYLPSGRSGRSYTGRGGDGGGLASPPSWVLFFLLF
jgi:hypothetical protein